MVGLSILLRGTVQEKLKWAFNLYDINKDGYITKEVWGTEAWPVCPPAPMAAAQAVLPPLPSPPRDQVGDSHQGLPPLLGSVLGPKCREHGAVCPSPHIGFSSASVLGPALLTEGPGETRVEKPRVGLALAPTNQEARGGPHHMGPQLGSFGPNTFYI